MKRLKTWIWIALTPVALTLAFAGTAAGGGTAPEGAGGAAAGGHHVLTNPIQNFSNFSYAGKDDHGGTWEPGEHKMPPPFSMALLNFAALLIIVGKFFAPSIARMTRDRHEAISKALDEGTRLRDEAKRKLEEYSTKLASLDAEIEKLVAGLRAEADAEKQRILDEAHARAERMQRDAEQQIAAEMQRVRVELEREAVLHAIAAAEKILTEKTTEADHKALVDRFVSSLESRAGAGRAG